MENESGFSFPSTMENLTVEKRGMLLPYNNIARVFWNRLCPEVAIMKFSRSDACSVSGRDVGVNSVGVYFPKFCQSWISVLFYLVFKSGVVSLS